MGVANATFGVFTALMFTDYFSLAGEVPVPLATECSFKFCINTYNASTTGGVFEEHIMSSSTEDYVIIYDMAAGSKLMMPARPCYHNGIEVPEPWNDKLHQFCNYNISTGDLATMGGALNVLQEGYGWDSVYSVDLFSSPVFKSLYGYFGAQEDIGTLGAVERAFDSLTNALTTFVRVSPEICGDAVALGSQFADQLYTRVRWLWVLPMLMVLGLTLIFLVATVAWSWKQQLWKSSPLAYVVHQPVTGDGELLQMKTLSETGPNGSEHGPHAVQVTAKGVAVRFRKRT